MTDTQNLLLLMSRPQESIALTKGQKTRTQFIVPTEYLEDSLKPFANEIVKKSSENADEYVHVKHIKIPSLGNIKELSKDAAFSIFIPKHQKLAADLIELLLDIEDTDDLLAVAIYIRERINPYLFQYAYSVALLHRPDTKDLELPAMVNTFPDTFFPGKVINKAREYATIVPEDKRKPIDIPNQYTASKQEQEQLLHYFREDIGVSLHHWTWHLVYPTMGPLQVVDKDRRGEMFYYMHRQMLSRFDFERLSNNLKRTKPLVDLDAPIEEAYFPKLDRMLTNRSYASRAPNQKLKDLNRVSEGLVVSVNQLKRSKDLIVDAIDRGFVRDTNMNPIPLTEENGIDMLGNMIESTIISPNQMLYGNIHNIGHSMISLVHDPDGRNLEQFSVMGGTATAVRDPVFYRWHGLMESMFSRFKDKISRYTEKQLDHPGVVVESIQVTTEGENPNILRTFWSKSTVNIADGIDFQNGGDLFIRFTHLQHADFTYTITVVNNNEVNVEGTCRIFMSPKYDEDGNTWKMNEQRNMFIELDKFKVILKKGKNTITQPSTASSVTIPYEQTYRDLTKVPVLLRNQTRFCGCGWPHNLLIPRGKPEGMPCELFVMISNYKDDKVDQEIDDRDCKDSVSFCGLKDKLYPDKRSMGYPFDRIPRQGVKTLKDFMTPNMNVQDVSIVFDDNVYLNKVRL